MLHVLCAIVHKKETNLPDTFRTLYSTPDLCFCMSTYVFQVGFVGNAVQMINYLSI